MTMHSRLIDSHIYIINKWIVDFLTHVSVYLFYLLSSSKSFLLIHQNQGSIESLKGELIPYIVKKQMSRLPHNPENEKPMSVVNVNTKLDDIYHFISQNELDRKITETSLFNDSDNRNPFSDDLIRCYALSPQEHCFGIRVNATPAYCAVNQKVSLPKLYYAADRNTILI